MVALGGVRGCSGGGGHAWLLWGVCMVAPGGHVWLLLGVGGVHGIRRDTEIRSMSDRYASYWNAFLFEFTFNNLSVLSFSCALLK